MIGGCYILGRALVELITDKIKVFGELEDVSVACALHLNQADKHGDKSLEKNKKNTDKNAVFHVAVPCQFSLEPFVRWTKGGPCTSIRSCVNKTSDPLWALARPRGGGKWKGRIARRCKNREARSKIEKNMGRRILPQMKDAAADAAEGAPKYAGQAANDCQAACIYDSHPFHFQTGHNMSEVCSTKCGACKTAALANDPWEFVKYVPSAFEDQWVSNWFSRWLVLAVLILYMQLYCDF
jgi:hypothetical protein